MTSWPEHWPAAIERVACVMPHPDDEVFCAGLLATAAAAGAEVTLVCATRGERGFLFGSRAEPAEVARVRTAELETSCRAIGAGPPIFLDRPDGGVATADAGRVAETIAAIDPQLVVTYGADGAYGHRDHIALSRMLTALGGGWRLLRLAFPRGLFDELAQAMRQRFADLVLEVPLGVEGDQVGWTLALDEHARAVKRAVIAAHASQLRGDGVFLFPELEPVIFTSESYLE